MSPCVERGVRWGSSVRVGAPPCAHSEGSRGGGRPRCDGLGGGGVIHGFRTEHKKLQKLEMINVIPLTFNSFYHKFILQGRHIRVLDYFRCYSW